MKYTVIIPKKVKKEIKKIDPKYQVKIYLILSHLAKNPFIGKKLDGDREGEWSYRVWPYRILYRIKKRELKIILVKVGHRQGVYNS